MLRANLSRWIVTILVAGLLPVITWLVYGFQDTAPSYIHLYYIPIMLAGFFLGFVGGSITGLLAAGLAWGITYFGKSSLPGGDSVLDITVRSVFFFSFGVLTAWLSNILGQKGEEASTLFSVAHAVSQSLRLEDVLPTIVRMATEITEGRAAVIRLLSAESDELLPVASWGLSRDYLAKGPVRVGDSPIDESVMKGRIAAVWDVRRDVRFRYREEAGAEGLVSLICVPLQRGEKSLGVLRVYSDHPRHWSRPEQRLLRAIAGEAAVAIENAQLHENLRRSYWETVRALTRAIEAKDPQVLGHSERVTDYALQIGQQMRLSAEDLESLRFAAALHDIGKIAVEEQLLHAPNPLSYREALERNHPLVGMSILQPAEFLRPALSGVRYHHERYDGGGYPDGLKGEDIPLIARILAVANTYDHLTSGSGERLPLPPEKALAELQHEAGSALDPQIVEALTDALGQEVGAEPALRSLGEGGLRVQSG